jgi:actin related protein 2/3 complex subunit 3
MREEISLRMLDKAFIGEEKNKWWMSFSKRKFMNKQL